MSASKTKSVYSAVISPDYLSREEGDPEKKNQPKKRNLFKQTLLGWYKLVVAAQLWALLAWAELEQRGTLASTSSGKRWAAGPDAI